MKNPECCLTRFASFIDRTHLLIPTNVQSRAFENGWNSTELSHELACQEKGLEPRRNFSGKFNLGISPELHESLAITAQAEGRSINSIAQEALQNRVAS